MQKTGGKMKLYWVSHRKGVDSHLSDFASGFNFTRAIGDEVDLVCC